MRRPSHLVLDDEIEMALGGAVGRKLSVSVENTSMENETSMRRRWAAIECSILNERFADLTEQELEWVAEGMLRDLLMKAYGGYYFSVAAKVHCHSEKEFTIYYHTEVFE